jgi:glutathione S-transferase
MNKHTAAIEKRLDESSWLVGDSMTAADVTAAPSVFYAMLPPEAAQIGPIHAFFATGLKLGEGRDRTREWAKKVMAYDR